MNRLRGEHGANLVAGERELARLEARRKKLVESIMEGVPGSEVKDELIAIAARREELQRQHCAITEPKPLLHPEVAAIYPSEGHRARQSASGAGGSFGGYGGASLVDAIVLTPDKGGETLQIDLRGNLAAMLGATVQTKRSPESDDLSLQVSLVAGARNPLNLEFTWSAA